MHGMKCAVFVSAFAIKGTRNWVCVCGCGCYVVGMSVVGRREWD